MPDVQDILKNVGSKIGRTEIDPSNPGQLDDLKSEITAKKISEFEESLRVEGVKSTVDKDKNSPTYQRLDPQIAKSIDVFFRGITQEEFSKYAEQEGNQGKSSNGEPFKCYAEIDGNGNIIVTPTKMIKITNKDEENGEYEETRQNKDGTFSTVILKKVHGDIVGASHLNNHNLDYDTLQKYRKLSKFYSHPNNIQKLEMRDMNEEQKIMYTQGLQKYGIKNGKYRSPEEMTKEEYLEAKAKDRWCTSYSDSKYSKNGEFSIGNFLYDDEKLPRSVSFVSTKGTEMKEFKSFRRTDDGRYLDTDCKFVNGEAVFDVLSYEEVLEKMESLGIDTNLIGKMNNKVNKDLNNSFPKEAEKIANKIERDREKQPSKENKGEEEPSI